MLSKMTESLTPTVREGTVPYGENTSERIDYDYEHEHEKTVGEKAVVPGNV